MNESPKVKPGDWITVGSTPCVVCKIYDHHMDGKGVIEVVHLKGKSSIPINQEARWENGEWRFIHASPTYGGYADLDPRWRRCVEILLARLLPKKRMVSKMPRGRDGRSITTRRSLRSRR